MSCSRLALLLLVLSMLAPLQGLAQTPPPLVPAPTPETPYAPEAENPGAAGLPADELIPRERTPSESLGLKIPRIILEVLGGSALGLIAGIPGGLILAEAAFSSGSTVGTIVGGGLAVAGLSFGSALGIKGLGSLLDGEGRFLTTLAGASVGGLGALGLALIVALVGGPGELGIIPVLIAPIVGGIIAFESSHANALQERSAQSSSTASVVPVISVSPRGGVIGGLAGRF
jgi:hypothetical protein